MNIKKKKKNAPTIAIPPLINQAPGPANAPVPPVVPLVVAPVVLSVVPHVVPPPAGLPPQVVALLQSSRIRYLQSFPHVIYPHRITRLEVDLDIIAGRVVVAGAQRGYLWRVEPAVPPGGVYPVRYSEADPVLTLPTYKALMTAIVSHFTANRNRRIR